MRKVAKVGTVTSASLTVRTVLTFRTVATSRRLAVGVHRLHRVVDAGPLEAEDDQPIDPLSSCLASRDYSKAYLNHLFKAGEYLGPMLLSWHNIAFFQAMMSAMRSAIAEGRFEAFRSEMRSRWLRPADDQPG